MSPLTEKRPFGHLVTLGHSLADRPTSPEPLLAPPELPAIPRLLYNRPPLSLCPTRAGAQSGNLSNQPTEKDNATMWRSKRLLAVVLVIALLGAVAAWALLARARPVMRWSQVLEAVEQRETVHATGWLYPSPGMEWRYSLWARGEPRGEWESKGMLLPGVGAEEADPDAQVQELCDAMATCWLPVHWGGKLTGRRVEWAGLPMWEFEIDPSREMRDGKEGRPYRWRLLVDPETRLVRRLEILVRQEGVQRLAGWCDYEYELPLPPEFEEAPG